MTLTPETIQAVLEVAGLLIGGASTAVFFIWRLSKYFHKSDSRMAALAEVVSKLTEAQAKLHDAMVRLTATVDAREKDGLRLEGALETTRRDLTGLTKELNGATAQLTAMWKTLQRLFPDKVPARLSDKKP